MWNTRKCQKLIQKKKTKLKDTRLREWVNEWMNVKKKYISYIPFICNCVCFYKWISTWYISYSAHIYTVRLGVITFLSWCFEAKEACNSKCSIFSFAHPTAVRRIWRANSEGILTGVWNRFGWLESASRCSSSVVLIIASWDQELHWRHC